MALLYLTDRFPVWSETFISREVASLRELIPLSLWARRPGDSAANTCQYLARGQSASSEHSRVNWIPKRLRLEAARRRHADEINRLTGHAEDAGALALHAAFGGICAILAGEVARRLAIPWSCSIHAADVQTSPYSLAIYDSAADVIACNHHVAQPFERPVSILHHGLSLPAWPRVARNDGGPLLWIGRMVQKKHPLLAVQIVRELRKQDRSIELVMLGDGPLRAALPDEPWLTAPGVCPPPAVREYMQTAGCLLQTSQQTPDGNAEGIPNVLIEAFASGLPVVASQSGGVHEVLTPTTGWPVDKASAAAFVPAVTHLFQDPVERNRRTAAARRLTEQQFDHQKLIRRKAERIYPPFRHDCVGEMRCGD